MGKADDLLLLAKQEAKQKKGFKILKAGTLDTLCIMINKEVDHERKAKPEICGNINKDEKKGFYVLIWTILDD